MMEDFLIKACISVFEADTLGTLVMDIFFFFFRLKQKIYESVPSG